jgi:hypothetical protein
VPNKACRTSHVVGAVVGAYAYLTSCTTAALLAASAFLMLLLLPMLLLLLLLIHCLYHCSFLSCLGCRSFVTATAASDAALLLLRI